MKSFSNTLAKAVGLFTDGATLLVTFRVISPRVTRDSLYSDLFIWFLGIG